jgi:LysM repeat protein
MNQTPSAGSSGNSGSTSTPGNNPSGGGSSYTVRPGDTLGNIAYANHTTVSAIAAASGIQNVNLIYPGQVVTIRRP